MTRLSEGGHVVAHMPAGRPAPAARLAACICKIVLAASGSVFALGSGAVSPALAAIASPAPSASPLVLERVFSDGSEPIHARVGQTFVIALDANRTTGYSWQLVARPDAGVQPLGTAYETSRAGLPGAGGQELWLFRAVAAGDVAITLEYVRPFDSSTRQNAKRVTFNVEVES